MKTLCFDKTSLEAKVFRFVRSTHLFDEGVKLVVAVSGGPDSVCLLHVLLSLHAELGLSLHVAHLNHGLRGPDSDGDAHYVADLVGRLGLPATIESRDVRAYQVARHLSLEEAGREVRYAFLADVAAATGSRAVASGHTLDDNVETILMHLVRGSGVAGMRGLLPASHLDINGKRLLLVRPLLPVAREETMAYCRELGLTPRSDVTNLSLEPFRNRIRHELIPLMETYNPRIKEALLRTAAIAADEIDFLETEAQRQWDRLARVEPLGVVLDKEVLCGLPPALQRHLLRRAVQAVTGTLKDFESGHVEDMLELLNKPAGKRLELSDGLIFSVEYDRYVLACGAATLCPFPVLDAESSLTVPGQIQLSGWTIRASLADCSDSRVASPFDAYLDLDKVGDSIVVRARRRGDVFQPLGMTAPVKIKDFMINARVPRAWRARVPVFASRQGIIWVGGWRIDERVKLTPETTRVLHLQMERLAND